MNYALNMKDKLKKMNFFPHIKMKLFIAAGKNTWSAKIIRTFTSMCPVSNKRQGKCNNCGACCKLPTACAFLKVSADGSCFCRIYKWRPPSCRVYPRTDEEFITKDICGYKFKA